jgi:hypothetical protein
VKPGPKPNPYTLRRMFRVEYEAWMHMRRRCLDKYNNDYHNWGGRGITICNSWLKFKNFLEDMGPKPNPNLTLERLDNNGNYEPNNCIWDTRKNQAQNTRKVFNSRSHQIRKLTKVDLF